MAAALHTVMPNQEPLLEAARVRFVGMSLDSLDEPPELDDTMTFEVKATCTGRLRERMRDGELRRVAIMTVDEVTALGSSTHPERDPELSYGDEDGEQ